MSYRDVDEDSSFLKLPEVENAGYLVALLNEAGLASSNGMGVVPLSWQEIDSWLKCTNLELSVWEKLTIKLLSETYVGEFSQASAKDRPPPYVPQAEEPKQLDRDAVADKLRNAFRSMKRNPSGKGK